MISGTSFRDYVMAMERVERWLRRVTAALDAAGIPYAVIGGNAVAAWVATEDPGATRTTKGIDLLVRREDLDRISQVMSGLGLQKQDLRRLVLFVDPAEPSRRSGVHLVWAGEKVRPSYGYPAPPVDNTVLTRDGYRVLDLPALIRMKLTSFRDIDRVHVADLLHVGLIDRVLRETLPIDLLGRLEAIEASLEGDE